jgi:surface antigen
MRIPTLLILSSVFLVGSSAAPASARNEELIGTGVGAAVGGLFGSQFGKGSGQLVSTGLGVAVGGAIGNNIGRDMEEQPSAPQDAYVPPSGDQAPIVYNSYAPNYVAPPAPPPAPPTTYVDQNNGTYCRPYSQEIRIDGQIQESFGTACLQPDGTWRIVQ